MKKHLALLMALILCLSACTFTAHADSYLNFFNHLDNEATIEWLEDAHAKAPEEVLKFYRNGTKNYKPSPLLDEFPAKTAVVYRTANFYGGQTAVRNNTAVTVFVDKTFETLDDAKAYLESLGLIRLIDSVIGSVVLVTPADGVAFGEADLENFYDLHDAMFHQRTMESVDGGIIYHADSEYFGAYGKVYMIGIDGGATFVNNYIAPGRFDCIGLVAGLMLVNGEMEEGLTLSNYVPVYLLNGSETALAAYRAIDGTDEYAIADGLEIFTNSKAPLRKVMARTSDAEDISPFVEEAFMGLFVEAQRLDVIRSYDQVASYELPYLDYVDMPPIARYALSPRNAVVNGVTKDGGLHISLHKSEQFSEVKTQEDEYMQSWYEALPEDVLNNTAPEHSVPLVVALHGTQDDPLMFMDEIGWLEMAGQNHLAVVAPFTDGLVIVKLTDENGVLTIYDGIMKYAIPMIVNYMLETYPALDPSRVYASGYSLGGGSTYRAIYACTDMFAACVPMAGAHVDLLYTPTEEEEAKASALGMPTMVLTSTYDVGFTQAEGRVSDSCLLTIDAFSAINGLENQPYDFEANPIIGIKADRLDLNLINGEWRTFLWTRYNEAGVPIVEVSCTENLKHSLYPGYAEIAYNYMKHFSRDMETGAVIYDADVK